MLIDELIKLLHEYLKVDNFQDYAPNGLQVQGVAEVKKIVTGVSASLALFKEAVKHNADTIIVHHGLIWNSERPIYKGSYKERIKFLLEHDINLFGYHLPLDAHPEVGNNAQIAKHLELSNIQPFGDYKNQKIGFMGETDGLSASVLLDKCRALFKREPTMFEFGPSSIDRIGVISGGAPELLKQAVDLNLDAFITGEVNEPVFHYAEEEGIHFISAGHHATERFGVKALGKYIEYNYKIEHQYIEIDNPI